MSDLIVAVVLLAAAATVLIPKHVRRDRVPPPIPRRELSHVNETHPADQERGSP